MTEPITLTELNVIIVENAKNLESILPNLGEAFTIDWYEGDFFESLVKEQRWAEVTTGYKTKVLFRILDNAIYLYTSPAYADNLKVQVRSALIDF